MHKKNFFENSAPPNLSLYRVLSWKSKIENYRWISREKPEKRVQKRLTFLYGNLYWLQSRATSIWNLWKKPQLVERFMRWRLLKFRFQPKASQTFSPVNDDEIYEDSLEVWNLIQSGWFFLFTGVWNSVIAPKVHTILASVVSYHYLERIYFWLKPRFFTWTPSRP
jgi:hypothetical protein